jgi:ATP-dependent exoDNAse (exonuclease V) beta subunit
VKLDEDDPVAVSARAWDAERSLQSAWQVASYSSMVRGRTLDAAEPQRPELEWVRSQPAVAADGADVELSEPSLVGELGELIGSHGLFGGTEVGTWTHAVYEHLDFAERKALDGAPLAELIKKLGTQYGISSDEQVTLLEQVVLQSLQTGLDGPNTNLPDGFTLGKIVAKDRVDEMAFDLKVGAGNRWTRATDLDTRLDAEAAAKALQQRVGDPG